MAKPTVVITSVGSLVGQVILDALEGRRSGVDIVGCNAGYESPNNYRCDRVHLTPATDDPAFCSEVDRIVDAEGAALLIPGRDPDIVTLSRYGDTNPKIKSVLLAGSAPMAQMMADKALTLRFSRERSLPYVESVETDERDASAAAHRLAEKHGFPLIAKPTAGSGSIGVRVIADWNHLSGILPKPSMLIQPFLDPPKEIGPADGAGLPLFWESTEENLYGVQTLIGRTGQVGPSCAFRAQMVMGRCERLEIVDDERLMAVGRAYAEAVAAEGWRGPINVQAKRDRAGSWKVIELNGRFSGGTSARRLTGFDEVALVLNEWTGAPTIPPLNGGPVGRTVVRQFTDRLLEDDAVDALATSRYWERPR